MDDQDRVRLMHITHPQKYDPCLFPETTTDLKPYVYLHREILSSPAKTEYSFHHDLYGVGLMMWEIWTGQRAFQEVIGDCQTLLHFIKFLSDEKNSLGLGIDDGLGIPEVNSWNDGIIKCQNLSVNAEGLLGILNICKKNGSNFISAQVPVSWKFLQKIKGSRHKKIQFYPNKIIFIYHFTFA